MYWASQKFSRLTLSWCACASKVSERLEAAEAAAALLREEVVETRQAVSWREEELGKLRKANAGLDVRTLHTMITRRIAQFMFLVWVKWARKLLYTTSCASMAFPRRTSSWRRTDASHGRAFPSLFAGPASRVRRRAARGAAQAEGERLRAERGEGRGVRAVEQDGRRSGISRQGPLRGGRVEDSSREVRGKPQPRGTARTRMSCQANNMQGTFRWASRRKRIRCRVGWYCVW